MTHFTSFPNISREIKRIILQYEGHKYPQQIYFNMGMEHPQFKIIIEKIDNDTYTDSRGQKWKKVKE